MIYYISSSVEKVIGLDEGPMFSNQRTMTSKDVGNTHWVPSGMCETSKTWTSNTCETIKTSESSKTSKPNITSEPSEPSEQLKLVNLVIIVSLLGSISSKLN